MLGLRRRLPLSLPPRLPSLPARIGALGRTAARPPPPLLARALGRWFTSALLPPPPPPGPFAPPPIVAHSPVDLLGPDTGRRRRRPRTAVERLYERLKEEEARKEAETKAVVRPQPRPSPPSPSTAGLPSGRRRSSLPSARSTASTVSGPVRAFSGGGDAAEGQRTAYTFPPLPSSSHRPPRYVRRCSGPSPPRSHRHAADEEPCHASSLYRQLRVYRYDPETGGPPYVDSFALSLSSPCPMLLDCLLALKAEADPGLSFRRSCREGVCGSCAMNVDGRNGLACVLPSVDLRPTASVFPLPHQPVIRDLVTDQSSFFRHYHSVQPYLQPVQPQPSRPTFPFVGEYPQSPAQRHLLDGSYECILCACCSTACPEFWWKADDGFLGPAALLHSYRWMADTRDGRPRERLRALAGERRLWECKAIANCAEVCPKHLNPALLIHRIKRAALLLHKENAEEERQQAREGGRRTRGNEEAERQRGDAE